jgi:hypothetical protein
MADPIARRPAMVSRLIRLTMIAGLLTALITAGSTPTVVPLGCGIKWTRTGVVWIATPDCSQQSPPSEPPPTPPDAPPPAASPTP